MKLRLKQTFRQLICKERDDIARKHMRYIFFHIFASEDIENMSVLVYGKTRTTI